MLDQIRTIARRAGLRRFWRRATPGNFLPHETTPEAIADQVDYALGCGRSYLDRLKGLGVAVEEASILEVGPGIAFGAMAYLRAHGAKVAVADAWLAPWRDPFHPAFYAKLTEAIEEEAPNADVSFLHRAIANGGYDDEFISLHKREAEALSDIESGSIDFVFSNAVLEHLRAPSKAFEELHRVTRSGGYGVHQVDFRDHRDFSNPLEHLLLSAKEFSVLSKQVHREYGAQMRQPEYADLLNRAGFSIIDYHSNDSADEFYLDTFEPRLRASPKSPYKDCPRETLADLGGLFTVQRPA
ncbi:MAG: methyltransferase domain-containing protein [Pseudomonadota bacterium]